MDRLGDYREPADVTKALQYAVDTQRVTAVDMLAPCVDILPPPPALEVSGAV